IAKNERKFLPVLALAVAGFILSHNVIAAIFLPFFLLISLRLIREKLKIISAFGLGIIAASFFWIPAIFDIRFVRLSQIKVSEVADHLVSFQRLFIPQWGYGPNPNGQDPLPVQIGIVVFFIFLGALYLRFLGKIKDKLVDLGLLIFIVVVFLMTRASLPIWQFVPAIDVIQFPWRLLSLVVFIAAYLTATVVNFSRKKEFMSVLVILAAIVSTITYVKPASFVERGDGFYATNEDSTTVRDEYLPLWAGEKPKQRADYKIEILEGIAKIDNPKIRPTKYQATIDVEEESRLQINTVYFPGWQVIADNQKVKIDYQNQFGLIQFKLPKGKYEVIISYGKTPVHLASEMVSLAAIITAGVLVFREWQNRNS
ncbi:hypothetical protein HYW39_00045, partial [Candidatus Curtissbacteria bacterium]|nr:hypothetical protein [Candidatus Curtissbacteria bacterium]